MLDFLHSPAFESDMVLYVFDSRSCGSNANQNGITYGETEALEALNVVEYARLQGRFAKIYLLGMSGGAAAVLLAAYGKTAHPGQKAVSGVISFASFSSVGNALPRDLRFFSAAFDSIYRLIRLKHRFTDPRPAIDQSPAQAVATTKNQEIPLLLIHGETDELVPESNFKLLSSAASVGLRDFAPLLLPGCGHSFPQLLEHSLAQINAFLKL
jgi:alpha-beta hydrolase superfamily lysophospholipase